MTERILYLPIFEPGSYHERSLLNKQGLRHAFEAIGECTTLDYIFMGDRIFPGLYNVIDRMRPTLIFTQLGSTESINPNEMRTLKVAAGCPVVNWNGDYDRRALVGPDILPLLHEIDLQLVIDAAVLPIYEREGIPARFWPFGYEVPNRPLPDVPGYDVVYLGNCYSDFRRQLYDVLRSLTCKVGIYGNGWPQNEGECTYDFTMGHALYRKAKMTISDNQYTDSVGYLSNRPFQAMAAGCLVLQQDVNELERWTGLVEGTHYIGFKNLEAIPELVKIVLDYPDLRRTIAEQGCDFVTEHHSFEKRVQELYGFLAELKQ